MATGIHFPFYSVEVPVLLVPLFFLLVSFYQIFLILDTLSCNMQIHT